MLLLCGVLGCIANTVHVYICRSFAKLYNIATLDLYRIGIASMSAVLSDLMLKSEVLTQRHRRLSTDTLLDIRSLCVFGRWPYRPCDTQVQSSELVHFD